MLAFDAADALIYVLHYQHFECRHPFASPAEDKKNRNLAKAFSIPKS